MKAPSRKTITAGIFFAFLLFFIGGLGWYFGAPLLQNNTDTSTQTQDDGGIFNFFPFGRGGSDSTTVTTPNGNGEGNQTNQDGTITDPTPEQVVRFRQITEVPTAGAIFFRSTVENDSVFATIAPTETVIRYIETETGHVYQTSDAIRIANRISNTTIPRIAEADWYDQDRLIIRYVDQNSNAVRTFSASLTDRAGVAQEGETETLKLAGVFLPENIKDITINTLGDVFYTKEEASGLVGIATDLLGQDKKQIFSSPLTEWKPDWAGREQIITMTSYPSSILFGMSQLLNRSTERLSPFVSGRAALDTLLSPNGERALVSSRTGSDIVLHIRNQDGVLVDTGLSTFAEKCVWSSDNILAFCAVPVGSISGNAPEDWYQGLVNYSDDIWRINTETGSKKILFSPFDEAVESLDVIDIKLSADEKYMYFKDKENLYLWSYLMEL